MMKLKLDDAGHVVVQDNKPVYIYDADGKEVAFDAPGTVATISRINGEAKNHRLKAEEYEGKLKAYADLDPEAARKALETVSNLDSKSLVAAGEVEKIREAADKAWAEKLTALEKKYEPVVQERDSLNSKLIERTIGGAFDGSKFISDKLAVPAPMVKATFGQNFKVEGDSLVGYDGNGGKIYSRERPGEVASFEEALGLLVEASPFRDSILKGSGASGGGAPGSGGGSGGSKTMTRTQFDAMDAGKKAAFFKGGGKLSD
jgi:hypothetical protein